MDKGYSKYLIEKNLKKEGISLFKKKGKTYIKQGEKVIEIPYSHGVLSDYGLAFISKKTGIDKFSLGKKPNFLEQRVASFTIAVLCIGLVTLILSKTTLTGFAINNIPDTTSNIGIFVCVIGILGLLYYRNKGNI